MISQQKPDGIFSRITKSIKNFIYSTVAKDGAVSSKRVVTVSTLIVWLGLIIYTILAKVAFDPTIFYGMMAVILGGAGISTAETIQQSKIKAGVDAATNAKP